MSYKEVFIINFKKIFLFLLVSILFISIGLVSATDELSNDTSSNIQITTPSVEQESIQIQENIMNSIEKDSNIKENTNLKANEEKTYNVNNYQDLCNAIDESNTNQYTSTITLNGQNTDYMINNNNIIPINTNITINGQEITISRNYNDGNAYSIFNISKGNTLTINNLIITNNIGSAINNSGTLNVINSTLKDNTALGSSTIYINNCGGAIYSNNGNVTIVDSTLTNNIATRTSNYETQGFGGAIYINNGTLTIIGSTLNNNTANSSGNPNGLYAQGGAIHSNNTNVTIINSTLNNNTAVPLSEESRLHAYGGAIDQNIGSLTIINSTLNYNNAKGKGYGGAISNRESVLTIINSTIMNNTVFGDDGGPYGGAIYNNYNATLINNTFANNTALASSMGGAIYNEGNLTIFNNTFTNNNAHMGAGIFNFKNLIVSNSTFDSNKGYDGAGIFSRGNILIIHNVSFINNYVNSSGGAIRTYSDTNITNGTFINNTAYGSGGAIDIWRSNLNIINSTFTNNRATYSSALNGHGGAICYNGDQEKIISITNTIFTNNSANFGGALDNGGGTMIVKDSIFELNKALLRHGGVCYNKGTLNITNTTMLDNVAGNGGGVYTIGTLNLLNSTMNGNNATGDGGVIVSMGTTSIANSNFTNSNATYGGVICVDQYSLSAQRSTMDIINCTFNNNNASIGGVIYNYKTELTITNCTMYNNSATLGGALCQDTNSNMTLRDSTFEDNYVFGNRGYVVEFDNANNVTIIDNYFENNTDNTRDMLFSNPGANTICDIHGNIYIDNYLEDMFVDSEGNPISDYGTYVYDYDVYESSQLEIPVYMALRSVYNDSIRNGTVYLQYNSSNILTSNNVTNNHSTLSVKGSDLDSYDSNLEVNYTSLSKHYQNILTSLNIRVINIPTTITVAVNESDLNIGDSVKINGTLIDENSNPISNADIVMTINGIPVEGVQTDDNGTYEYVINNLELGNYTVEVYYAGSGNLYKPSNTAQTKYTVSTNTIIINIDKHEIYVDETVTIFGYVANGHGVVIQEGDVLVKIDNGTEIPLTLIEGEYFVVLNCTINGTYHANASFLNDDTVIVTSNNLEYNVSKIPTITTFNVINDTYGDVVIEVFVKENVEGKYENIISRRNLTITVDDKASSHYSIDDLNALIKLDTIDSTGDIVVTVVYDGNYKYETSNKTDTITVNPRQSRISVQTDKEQVKIGENVTIFGQVFDENGTVITEGLVEITIGNTTQDQTQITYNDTLGDYYYKIINITNTLGNVTITAQYLGNISTTGTYLINPSSNNTTINVEKINTNISLDSIESVTYMDNITITGILVDENNEPLGNQDVVLVVNGVEIPLVTDENGTFNKTLPANVAGINNVTVNYEGNDIYNPTSNNTTFNVEKLNTSINLDPVEPVTYGDNITITGKLVDENGEPMGNENITLVINGEELPLVTDENGIFNHTLPANTTGTNNITVTYPGDDNYNPTSDNTTVDVGKQDSKIIIDPVEPVTYGDNITISGKLVDENGEPRGNENITLVVNGVEIPLVTDENGIFNHTLPANTTGTNNITVTYPGDDNYNPTSDNTTVDVGKRESIITINPVDTVKAWDNVTLTGKLVDDLDNPLSRVNITLNINGKDEIVITDDTGVFQYNYTAEITGENTVTASFEGNNDYNPSSDNTTFSVTKLNVTIVIDPVRGKVLDDVEINVTVLDEKGNPVNGGRVGFKVNGITLRDDKGKAIQVAVLNGKASLTHTALETWLKDDSVIEVPYTGTGKVLTGRNTSTDITIIKRDAIVNLTVPETYVNSTMELITTVTDTNGSSVNTGIVIFKMNGKTLKDESGKTLIADVVNGTAKLEYKLPFVYGAYERNITAIFSSKIYNKAENTTKTKFKPIPIYIIPEPVEIVDEYTQPVVVARVYNQHNGAPVNGTQIIAIKLDGTTYFNKLNIVDGIINQTIPVDTYRAGKHTVEIAIGANSHYDLLRTNLTAPSTQKYTVTTTNITITKTGNTTILNALITDEHNRTITKDVKINIKVNGITLIPTETVSNGIIKVDLNTTSIKTNSTLTITTSETSYYKSSRTNYKINK